ncbi:hypothetical protein COV05_00205 [Candidatus Uhrbacteria bacterium CG10_big_fil_rev_8_21_14_0_10_48_16]|uniref:Uncharacterized protein n=1 Tax=Candidatus Uhrbacteria bacterium CG10_big_fil_rev_8_21_14_0_10_48_16 TaxID=1975038 RepID=A0A2M8LIJ4_9BACT|nr:MAG: hypothetical protein COV05_00205 [Candidatus Uhrbacteria bacterium CG10_big_fil_rev_8_21_14_0_10_48_16]
MARIEKNASLEKQITDVKGDVVREVRRRTHKGHPWLIALLIFLVLVSGVFIWGAWVVAETGLASVPILSSRAYTIPEPTRVVTPGVPVETVLEEEFTSTLTQRLYEGRGELKDRTLEARISEASLTASLRSIMEESGVEWLDGSNIQAVIEPGLGIEFFVPVADVESQTALKAIFSISAENGVVVVTPDEVMIGSAHVPNFLIASFLKPYLESELARMNAVMVGYAQISSIEVFSGELVMTGELSVELQKR